jgi:hypothetical protein
VFTAGDTFLTASLDRVRRLLASSVRVRSTGRSTSRTSALTWPGRILRRARICAGSCSWLVMARMVRLSRDVGVAAQYVAGLVSEEFLVHPRGGHEEQVTAHGGIIDTGRRGVRSCICSRYGVQRPAAAECREHLCAAINARSRLMPLVAVDRLGESSSCVGCPAGDAQKGPSGELFA